MSQIWFGEFGGALIDWSVPLSILLAIPVMLAIGLAMERGLIQHFYKRPHADQILVTFGLAIVLQEIVKAFFGANPIPQPAPAGAARHRSTSACCSASTRATIVYPLLAAASTSASRWRSSARSSPSCSFTTFGMVVRAGMADRETVGLLGIDIDRRFTVMFGLAAVVAGLAGVMYTPILLAQLPHGHGLPGPQLRRGGGRRHGLAGRARCWPGSCSASCRVLRLDERGQGRSCPASTRSSSTCRGRRPADPPARPDGPAAA